MLREASDEIAAEAKAEVKLPEDSSWTGDACSCPSAAEVEEDAGGRDHSCAEDRGAQPPAGPRTLVRTRSRALRRPSLWVSAWDPALGFGAKLVLRGVCGNRQWPGCKTLKWAPNSHSSLKFYMRR